jgi:hypothetical protein
LITCITQDLDTGTGANPTTVSYNASAVENNNPTSSLVFENKNIFFCIEKRSGLLLLAVKR